MSCFVSSPAWERRPNGKCVSCYDESTRETGVLLGNRGREHAICKMCRRRLGEYGAYLPVHKKRLLRVLRLNRSDELWCI